MSDDKMPSRHSRPIRVVRRNDTREKPKKNRITNRCPYCGYQFTMSVDQHILMNSDCLKMRIGEANENN
jgi:hypothetical protein